MVEGRFRRVAMRMAVSLVLAIGLGAVTALAQRGFGAQRDSILTNGRNLQVPINHGLPDQATGFTFCRLRYQNIRRARKSGWGDDYPQADYNFLVRLSELTKTHISRWNNGDPGFSNVTVLDPDLFACPFLRMQNAANYDFTPKETARMREYLMKGGFLWIDDNWDPDFEYIRPNIQRILPDAQIIDLPRDHPVFSTIFNLETLPQIPSMNAWLRSGDTSEVRGAQVHYYGFFDAKDRLSVLVSMNSDVSDSWEREGDSREYFDVFGRDGYALGVDVAVYAMTH